MTGHTDELEALEHSWAVLLTTFRRDGTPVGTPVNVAIEGDRAYFRTYDAAWKPKRLARDPRVELAPSSPWGKPRGVAVPGTGRQLGGNEAAHARQLLGRRHPIFQRLFIPFVHRLARYQTLYYEVTTVNSAAIRHQTGL